MANLPEALLGRMDSALPEEPEDYTDWEVDERTDARIHQHELNDQNTDEDWSLYSTTSWEDDD